MQVWSRPALHRLAHPAGPAVCGGILFQPDKTGKRTERRFPPDHLKVMGVHRRLSYETVGYASDYITQGSLPRDSDDGISSCTMREYFCGGKQTLLCVFFLFCQSPLVNAQHNTDIAGEIIPLARLVPARQSASAASSSSVASPSTHPGVPDECLAEQYPCAADQCLQRRAVSSPLQADAASVSPGSSLPGFSSSLGSPSINWMASRPRVSTWAAAWSVSALTSASPRAAVHSKAVVILCAATNSAWRRRRNGPCLARWTPPGREGNVRNHCSSRAVEKATVRMARE